MSVQAWVILGVYVLLLVISIITAIVQKTFSAAFFISFLFSIGFVALLTYDTHCLTSGYCGIWSWIRTGMYILFPVIFMIVYFFGLFSSKTSTATPAVVTVSATPQTEQQTTTTTTVVAK